jgi:NADH-quinone oxidoreductase subunit E
VTTQTTNLSSHAREVIDAAVQKYPSTQKRSAVLAALHEVQHENKGFLTEPLMDAVAVYLDMSPIAETKPVGLHSISICTNVSCMLRGSDQIVEHIEKKLNVKIGGSTADGRIYLKREEECLAACCGAPMMMVDHVYHENLTPEKVDEILAKLK